MAWVHRSVICALDPLKHRRPVWAKLVASFDEFRFDCAVFPLDLSLSLWPVRQRVFFLDAEDLA